jgi:hypothetical protein
LEAQVSDRFLVVSDGFIVPIIPWIFFSGYMAKIILIGIKGEDYVLLGWADWAELFILGLKLMGVGFIAALPFIILFGCGYLAMMSPAFLSGFAPSAPATGWSMLAFSRKKPWGICPHSFLP